MFQPVVVHSHTKLTYPHGKKYAAVPVKTEKVLQPHLGHLALLQPDLESCYHLRKEAVNVSKLCCMPILGSMSIARRWERWPKTGAKKLSVRSSYVFGYQIIWLVVAVRLSAPPAPPNIQCFRDTQALCPNQAVCILVVGFSQLLARKGRFGLQTVGFFFSCWKQGC